VAFAEDEAGIGGAQFLEFADDGGLQMAFEGFFGHAAGFFGHAGLFRL
jgi:hypothetical protein